MTDEVSFERITTSPELPARDENSHKGDCGRVLIIAGSRGMSGAACLAATAALRGGAGLVTAAVPEGIQSIVAGFEPSYLTAGLPEDDSGRIKSAAHKRLTELLAGQGAVAVGPGLGQSSGLQELVLELYDSVSVPMVVDADALNLLARRPYLTRRAAESPVRVLTPHPGEFSRLTGLDVAVIQQDRERVAAEYARQNKVILVLKGRGTIVTDGRRLSVNSTGNSGLATGGTGDVLTGIIVALLGQRLPAFEAARLAVHLHGVAGDIAAEELSKPGMIASDLLNRIGRAWCEMGS
ncbi:MAG: NAD(P)H-hydrate dehydratase [Planctomycetes bacterium]|nr:NAD(P)H-hydrate dehydratase [Planctomycetota bacterium]